MYNYDDLKEYIKQGKSKQSRTIAHNTIARIEQDERIIVKYHDTDICTILPDNSRQFFSGGWMTYTTKERMNNLLPSPFRLYQDRGKWFIWNCVTKDQYIYQDGIIVLPDNTVLNAGKKSDSDKTDKLRNRIKAYSKQYINNLVLGKINKPDAGDCFYCYMQSDGKSLGELTDNINHLESHLKEKYYVPSLFYNAIQEFKISMIANSVLYGLWFNQPEQIFDFGLNILREQGYKSLVKYLYQEFNLVR